MDPITIGVLAVVGLAVALALFLPHRPAAAATRPAAIHPGPAVDPGRALMSSVHDIGQAGAGHIIAQRFAVVDAEDFAHKVRRAFPMPDAPASPPNP